MNITPITNYQTQPKNNNSNPNFEGLRVSRRFLNNNGITRKEIKGSTTLQRLAKDYDVTIKSTWEKIGKRPRSLQESFKGGVPTGLLVGGSVGAAIGFASLGWGIATGIVTAILSTLLTTRILDDIDVTQYTSKIKVRDRLAPKDNAKIFDHLYDIDGDIIIHDLNDERLERITKGKNLYNAKDLLKIIKSKEVQSTKGRLLNIFNPTTVDPLICRIAGYVPNEEEKETYKKIINKLKKLPEINYDQSDMMEISILEKVMIAENEDFLDLIKDKQFNYNPVYDNIYKNISSQNFKEKFDNLDIVFRDLNDAVKQNSSAALEAGKYQFESPLYRPNKHGIQLLKILLKNKYNNRSLRGSILESYKEYLPKFADKYIEMRKGEN